MKGTDLTSGGSGCPARAGYIRREPGRAPSFRRIRHLDEVGTLRSVPQLPVEVLVDGGGGRVAANRPASARHTRTIRNSVMIQCDSTASPPSGPPRSTRPKLARCSQCGGGERSTGHLSSQLLKLCAIEVHVAVEG